MSNVENFTAQRAGGQLLGLVERTPEGVKITGDGTIQHPLTVELEPGFAITPTARSMRLEAMAGAAMSQAFQTTDHKLAMIGLLSVAHEENGGLYVFHQPGGQMDLRPIIVRAAMLEPKGTESDLQRAEAILQDFERNEALDAPIPASQTETGTRRRLWWAQAAYNRPRF